MFECLTAPRLPPACVQYMTCCYLQTERITQLAGQPADPEEPPVRCLFAERRIDGEWRKVSLGGSPARRRA